MPKIQILILALALLPNIIIAEPIATPQTVADSRIQGGLLVHLGCGNGSATAALRINERYIVHGLDSDAAAIEAAHKEIARRKLEGAVSVYAIDLDNDGDVDVLGAAEAASDIGISG